MDSTAFVPIPDSDAVRAFLVDAIASLHPAVDRGTLAQNEPFTALGIDSIQATQLSDLVAEAYGVSVPPTLAFEFPTLDQLATYIVQRLAGQKVTTAGPCSSSPTDEDSPRRARTFP
jgi:acyl carrier protein